MEKVGKGLDRAVLCVVQRPLLQEVGPSATLLPDPFFPLIVSPVYKYRAPDTQTYTSFKRPEWLCIHKDKYTKKKHDETDGQRSIFNF